MFGRRRGKSEEDPAVAPIEELLEAASARHPAGEWEGRVRHALSVCACVSYEDAPGWIIFDTDDGIGWSRWSDVAEVEDMQASLQAGGHAAPAEILAWLRGTAADPWGAGGDGWGDPGVVDQLKRWVGDS